jgi:hypothetical protein
MTASWYYVSQQITIPKAAVIESLALNCQATGTTFAHAFFNTSNAPSPAGGSGYAGAYLPLSPNPYPGSGYSAGAFLPPTIINFPILAGTMSVGVQGTAQATELRCFGYVQGHYTTT